MRVNTVELLAVEQLHANPDNPKKPLGGKYRKGLRASLDKFGFAGLFNVAKNPDGSYEVLDGNTRLQEVEEAGVEQVPCIVHDLPDRDSRREFVLSYDRHRKQFDEEAVLAQLRDLAERGRDVRELAKLSGKGDLQRLLDESSRRAVAANATAQKAPAMASLVLYGPAGELKEIGCLLKTVKGKLSLLEKARKLLGEAIGFLDWSDDRFLAVLLATLARFGKDESEAA